MQKILTETITLSEKDIKTILKEKFGNDYSVEVNLGSKEGEHWAIMGAFLEGVTLTRDTIKPV
jgi:hypothetical protein